MIRDDIKAATIAAMKGGDKETTARCAWSQAAIKNRDIEARTGGAPKDDDALVTEVLQKMVKQRRESADIYRKNGREDRAAAEEAEIAVIERFLPQQLSDAEAAGEDPRDHRRDRRPSMKDMGRVMALVKERLGASIEPARASGAGEGGAELDTRLPLAGGVGRRAKLDKAYDRCGGCFCVRATFDNSASRRPITIVHPEAILSQCAGMPIGDSLQPPELRADRPGCRQRSPMIGKRR